MKTSRHHEDDEEPVRNAVVGIEAPLVGIESAHYVRLVSLLQYCYDINKHPFNRKKKNDRS